MEVVQPSERYLGLWIALISLVILNLVVLAFLPPQIITHIDGTVEHISGLHAFRTMAEAQLFSLPFAAAILGALAALLPYKKLPYQKKYLRSWLLSLILLYAVSTIKFMFQMDL